MHSTIDSTVHSMHLNSLEHNYLARPGYEPGTSRVQVTVDTNEPSAAAAAASAAEAAASVAASAAAAAAAAAAAVTIVA